MSADPTRPVVAYPTATVLPTGLSRSMSTWRVVLLVVFALFGAFWGIWAAVLLALPARVPLSDSELGVALVAVAGAAIPTLLLAGRAAGRWGSARLVRFLLLAFAVAAPLPAIATTTTPFVLSLLLLGVATGGLDVMINVTASGWERITGTPMLPLSHAAFSFGVLGGSIGAGLARSAGATPSQVLGVLALICVLVALLLPREQHDLAVEREPKTEPESEPVQTEQLEAEPEQSAPTRWTRALLAVGLLLAGSYLIEDALQTWSGTRIERGLGTGPVLAALGPAVFALAMGLGRLGTQWLTTRVDQSRLLGSAGVLVAAGAVALSLAGTPTVALIALAIAGAGTSVVAPVLVSLVGRRATPDRQPGDVAWVSAVGYAGFLLGPPLVGVISGATSLSTALGLLAVLGLITAVAGARVAAAGPR